MCWKMKNKMGRRRPEVHVTDTSNKRIEDATRRSVF